MGVIYTITNQISGKVYVGQTKRDVKKRWWEHCNSKKEYCSYISNSLEYYGVDKFKFKIIHVCRDYELNEFEKFYIKEYNCMKPNGYNLTEGGENCIPTIETRKKQSEAKIGVKRGPQTEEHKKNIGNSNRGKKRTDVTKEKMRIAKLGKPLTPEHAEKIRNNYKYISPEGWERLRKSNEKAVEQILPDGNIISFESVRKASIALNVDGSGISKVCRGKKKSVRGLKFRYKIP